MMLFLGGIEIIIFLLLLSGVQALLGGVGLLRGGVNIHDTHVVNNVCPLLSEVSDEEISLWFFFVI